MGQQVGHADDNDEAARRRFARALLDDLAALETMIARDLFERGVRRIGVEQELFFVDPSGRAADLAPEVLRRLDDRTCTTELGKFNLECNLEPVVFGGGFLRTVEASLTAVLEKIRGVVRDLGGDVALVGILPSIALSELGHDRITALPRYLELNQAILRAAGGSLRTLISGIDDLQVVHDNVLLEACNTSFQIHWQTTPERFPDEYNLAQVISGPLVAAAANSPLLMQRRLWRETRIALFQQSLDFRSVPGRLRDKWQRVSFGADWIHESVLELFRDQVARHGVLITRPESESSSDVLARDEIPQLRALALHNGTVYHWNRACYGITDGRPHLRIEHRPLPAGPTVLDEVANAALFYGLMNGLGRQLGDVRSMFAFADVKANFQAAARYGLKASMHWTGGRALGVGTLLLEELLPVAREGLQEAGVPSTDIERYLGVIEARVRSGRTGAQWQLEAFDQFASAKSRVTRCQLVTAAVVARQWEGKPVHEWTVPDGLTGGDWRNLYRTVGQVMTTDLFTVRPDDLVDVAASVMQWKHVRHVPVEDEGGALVGLISYRSLLRVLAEGLGREGRMIAVRDIMTADPLTTGPDTPCDEAIDAMRRRGVSCLPVTDRGRLVGIVSERDFLQLAYRLYAERGGVADDGGHEPTEGERDDD